MAKHRSLPGLVVFALVATFLPLVGATAAGAQASPSGDPGLLGTEVRGTGVLPNFAEEGANLIRLQVGAFDPLADPLPAQPGIPLVPEATLAPGTAQYWLVQVRDNQFPAVADAVTAAGGLIVGYVHDDTYMVRATPAQSVQIEASPTVRWAGYYQPAWRVPVAAGGRQGLLELTGTRHYDVYVFREEPNPRAVGRALEEIAGVEVVGDAEYVVEVEATAAQIPAIATISAVEWVAVKPKPILLNANARWVTDTGVRDVFAATAPGRLTGAGQTAAVADTGINYKLDMNNRAHIAFRDCNESGVCKEAVYTQPFSGTSSDAMGTSGNFSIVNSGTGHRKMVAYFDLGNTGPHPMEESSHGTHTGGSVDGDQPPYGTWTGDDGMAPAAMHVHQNIGTATGGLRIPGDIYQLFRQAYRPRKPASVATTSTGLGGTGNPIDFSPGCTDPSGPTALSTCYRPTEDARTHNNSWGLVAPVVDEGRAVTLDRFVWDHEDFVAVFSAGNGGPGPATILSPSVAKNELSSGASANGRQPMVSIDSMASFSSHGPTGDGRIGPDLATPGQIVVSAKGGTADGYHTAQGTSMSAPVLTGLSTLVRQYFFDGYAVAGGDGFAAGSPDPSRRHNPSAALVKATLINGAVRMRGFYTGDDGRVRALDGQWPSSGQGFGRVSLNNSLFFAGEPTNNWYIDIYRGDSSGPPNMRSFPVSSAPASRTFDIVVQPGQPLDVTLSWTDAPNLLPAGTPALVNDLNLVVTGPGGAYVGNNFNSRSNPAVGTAETPPGTAPADTRNVTERIRIADPAAGTYTVTVQAPPIASGRQGFALAASGNISPVGGATFSPGPALQVDEPGAPAISGVRVEPVSADTTRVRFTTNEPTTATATVTPGGTTFVDSYNLGSPADLPGMNSGPVETSAEYANRPVLGTKHEILLLGLSPGQAYSIALSAKDLANNTATENAAVTSPSTVFQPKATDTGQLVSGDPPGSGWQTGTQMYAGNFGGDALLGAFMFRIPQGAVDPATITGAVVETTSAHNWMIHYADSDPVLSVDLLDESVEPLWGTQTYELIDAAASDARLNAETTHKRGDYHRYAWTFRCSELAALKASLSTVSGGERQAAFRYESTSIPTGIFSMDFGFNRRSRGPDVRPRLILFTGGGVNPTGEPCDPTTPAPAIANVGIHDGLAAGSVTVSWETDVASDSLVLFREQGTTGFTQVATPALTKVHQVQVFGLDETKEYEFAVRSAACNGATTTDTNGGKGYDFFQDPTPTDDFVFRGESTPPDDDQTQKTLFDPPYPPGVLTFDHGPVDEPVPVTQTGTPFADENFVGNGLGFFWTGPYSGTIDGRVQLPWYWSTTNPAAIAEGSLVEVTFFADPDYGAANRRQPQKIIGRFEVPLEFTEGAISLNTNQVLVRGSVSNELLIQVVPVFIDTGENLNVHYDSASTPSGFKVPLAEQPPVNGPVPAPSAGASGLNPPPTRTGAASAADVAAGTGYCDIPAQKADLSISKSDSPDPVFAGQELTYALSVSNNGPADATGVTVTDTLPPGVTFNSASASQGSCSESGGTVTCNLGGLGSGAPPATVTIKVTPQTAGTITNTGSVSANEEDPAPGNNSDTESTTVSAAADLAVTKTDAPDPAQVGQNLTYTIVVTNGGPQAASGVTALDQLPKNAGFGSVTTTKGTCSLKPQKRQVTCAIGDMASGESVTIIIVVKPTQKGTITNTVTVSAASPPDPNTANNTATATTVVRPSS